MPERTPARPPGEAGPVRTQIAAQPGIAARLPGAVLQSLLLAAVALFFLNFNILGTASPSKRFSQDLVYAWFGNEAWLYPRPTTASVPGVAHARKVVVVMLNEPALALRGARWPVPVQFHAQFLAELEVLKPHSIFLDFLLLDPAPPEDGCALLQVAQRLRTEGVALYLAVTEPQDLALLDVAGCHTLQGAPIRAAEVFTPVAVQRQADNSDFVSRRYPFEQRSPAGAPGSGLPSAAVRMYCDATPAPSQCLARLTAYASPDAGFDLAWSPQGDPFNQRWSQEGCAPSISPARAILNEPVLPRESPCSSGATSAAAATSSRRRCTRSYPGSTTTPWRCRTCWHSTAAPRCARSSARRRFSSTSLISWCCGCWPPSSCGASASWRARAPGSTARSSSRRRRAPGSPR